VVVEITGSGDVRFTAHDTNRWSVFTVECDAEECGSAEAVIDEVSVHCGSTGFGDPERTMIRVDLTGVIDSAISLDAFTVELSVRERLGLAAVKVRDHTSPYIDLDEAMVEESTRGAFVRAATAAAKDADLEEALVLEEALRYGLMALSGAEVGLR
jgi:hypothetical protein